MELKSGDIATRRRIVEENMPVEVENGSWLFTSPQLSLPRSCNDLEYSLSIGDGTMKKPNIIRINSKKSYFNGMNVAEADYWIRRKIENLIILSYMKESMKVLFV